MSNESPTTIAGEPILSLLEGLRHTEVDTASGGVVQVNTRLSGEVAASWTKAIERYGADFIGSDNVGDVASRHGQAFIRIVNELAVVVGAVSSDE